MNDFGSGPFGVGPFGEMNEAALLHKLVASVARVEGRLDGIQIEQKRLADAIERQNGRVDALERSVARMLGWAAGVGAMAAGVVSAGLKLL